MIGSLRGEVIEIMNGSVLLEVHGVGYLVRVSVSTLAQLKPGAQVFLYTHDHVREDVHDLFGFLSMADLALFEQLLGISGVGPKVAMTILSVGSADTVRRAIMNGDLATMTSVPGVGKKTAQKIILELKGQLIEAESVTPGDRDVIEALQSLGYSAAAARDALKDISSEIADTSARVREALRRLSKS
ncbi:MAG TPA: Holliday junction branch migration protein RuvA [Patescibacteria group bacterium]|nr:Holliday junction branch migration protein RuvA [Patescibacteria group bacterium]